MGIFALETDQDDPVKCIARKMNRINHGRAFGELCP